MVKKGLFSSSFNRSS